MRRIVICGALLLWVWSGLPLLLAGLTPPLENSPDRHPSYDLSTLDLSPERRAELQNVLQKKDYAAAETILVDEVNRDPKSFRAASLLEFAGGIFFLDGQYPNSIVAWKKAEAIAPLNERSRFSLAMADIKIKREDWARLELEKLSTSHTGNPLYQYWMGRLDYDAQKYNDAISRLNQVIALDPEMMRAYDLLGLCYDYLGKRDEAMKNLERAVELNRMQPNPSPWPSMDLAIAQIELNRLPDAEKNLLDSIRYDSRFAQARYQLGRVLEKREKFPEAIETLKAAAALDPAYADPHFLLGRIYHKLGQMKLAEPEIDHFQILQKQASSAVGSKPQ